MEENDLLDLVLPFIKKLATDVCDLPKTVVLKGYLAPGPLSAGGTRRWRVYLNHTFTDYWEIEDKAHILYAEDMTDDPQTPQMVWLQHGVSIRRVRSRVGEAELPLLDGPLAQRLLPTAPPAAPQVYGPPPYPYPPNPPDGGPWLPDDDPGWEWSKCKGCASASP